MKKKPGKANPNSRQQPKKKTKRKAQQKVSPNLASMRCLDCEQLNYVPARSLSRAIRHRCGNCGGPLEEITRSRRRRGLLAQVKAPPPRPKRNRCRCCGRNLEGPGGPRLHLETHEECLQYYHDEDYVLVLAGHEIMEGTLLVEKDGEKTYSLTGLNPLGEVKFLIRHLLQEECHELLDQWEQEYQQRRQKGEP